MSIIIREPPMVGDSPELQELSLWLFELRQKLVDEVDAIRALAPLIATNPTMTYWGDPGTDNTWRLRRVDNNFVVERRESGVYVSKFKFKP